MLPVLVGLKNLIKAKTYHIDFPLFRLHYQATVCLLLAFCMILTAKVMFGDTIDCVNRIGGHTDLFDNACYSLGTFSRYRIAKPNVSISSAIYTYPGILMDSNEEKFDMHWHTYYQYIPIILFIQACLFYCPHYLWKIWENGTISSVCKRLAENKISPSDYLESNHEIIYYLHNCFKYNKTLVYKYYLCHIMLMFNLMFQILALNTVFNYQFVTYGYMCFKYLLLNENIYGLNHISKSNSISMNNPMDRLFPKMTICHLDWASQAGLSNDSLEFICVLPLNILYDKFFLLLWFWFIILGGMTFYQIACDICYTIFRRSVIKRRYGKNSSLSEAFMLDLIRHNTDKIAFSALTSKLYVTSAV